MNGLKNVAGNAVSIFLFRFERSGTGMSFVINEAIAADMYPDLDEQIQPLAQVCGETLSRYSHLSVSDTMMDGTILDTGAFEVMLSRGLGRYFPETEKQQLFQDAKRLADLLIAVMDRRTKEEKEGKQGGQPHQHFSQNPKNLKKGLEALGHTKRLQAELQWVLEGQRIRPGLQPLRPEDLPPGVKAARGYDHRGYCVIFEHQSLGDLGKIVLINMSDGQTLIQAEFYQGQEQRESPLAKKRKAVFERIVATVNNRFDQSFPR